MRINYENKSLGLAGPAISADNCLLGTPLEHVQLQRRSESLISAVVLDLATILGRTALFKLMRNEFLAVEAMSCVVETPDSPGQYIYGADDAIYEPNMNYGDEGSPQDGWKVAPHHHRAPKSYYLDRAGRLWDHLAVSCVLRDRYYLPTCQMVLDRFASTRTRLL